MGRWNEDEGDKPIIWNEGQAYLLSNLTIDLPEAHLLFAESLNQHGQIGGTLIDATTLASTAIVLIPTDQLFSDGFELAE